MQTSECLCNKKQFAFVRLVLKLSSFSLTFKEFILSPFSGFSTQLHMPVTFRTLLSPGKRWLEANRITPDFLVPGLSISGQFNIHILKVFALNKHTLVYSTHLSPEVKFGPGAFTLYLWLPKIPSLFGEFYEEHSHANKNNNKKSSNTETLIGWILI